MLNGTLSPAVTQVGQTAAQIADWLRTLVPIGNVVELRALNVPRQYGYPKTAFGFFDFQHLDAGHTQLIGRIVQ